MRWPINRELMQKRLLEKTRRDTGGEPINGKRCLLWTGARNQWGYGVVRWRCDDGRRKEFGAHRLMLALSVDKMLEKKEYANHKCSRSRCVEPAHLYIGTALQNAQDRLSKKGGHAQPHWYRRRLLKRRERGETGVPGNTQKYVRLESYPYAPDDWVLSRLQKYTHRQSAPKWMAKDLGDCRIWTATADTHGYPRLQVHDKMGKQRTLRIGKWVLEKKLALRITGKHNFICHKCDVSSCVATLHLYLGGASSNTQDRKHRSYTKRAVKYLSREMNYKIPNNAVQRFLDEFFSPDGPWKKLYRTQYPEHSVAGIAIRFGVTEKFIRKELAAFGCGAIAHKPINQEKRESIAKLFYIDDNLRKPSMALKALVKKYGISNEAAAMQAILGAERLSLRRPAWVKLKVHSPSALAWYKEHQPERHVTLKPPRVPLKSEATRQHLLLKAQEVASEKRRKPRSSKEPPEKK